ncbi:MAG: site-specific DNA-methyltransferase [Microthrixaceae bacterium]
MARPSRTAGASGRRRTSTSTANFGSGRREAHDASAFYDRFVPPTISTESTVGAPAALDVIHRGDSRSMDAVPTASVALVVTSPPYFAGKQYEEELGVGGVPADYFEYLGLLRDVFAECTRVLEPGGRIAVNVANLGRRPYRSLSGDVTAILSDLGLLLRGEVVWWKGRAAGGSCAWGTFQRPSNPVLRDVTERVVIASKGRFDRALTPEQRRGEGLPSAATISREEFMEATTDLWELAPESARRVGHPAPFPVELPQRVIELYTYEGDVVLDPFMGSGSTAVAAVRTDRHFVGYDTDPAYIDLAVARVAEERGRRSAYPADDLATLRPRLLPRPIVTTTPRSDPSAEPIDITSAVGPVRTALREGRPATAVAAALLAECGFVDLRTDVRPRSSGVSIDLVATDSTGREWAFLVAGSLTSGASGMRSADTFWRVLGTAAVLHEYPTRPRTAARTAMPLVVITTALPPRSSPRRAAMAVMSGPGAPVLDVIRLLDSADHDRLRTYATSGCAAGTGERP